MYSTVKTFESFDGRERVLISRRPDGNYTYRRQWLSAALPNDDPDSPIVNAGQEREMPWDHQVQTVEFMNRQIRRRTRRDNVCRG
jgi:hypothetical protein